MLSRVSENSDMLVVLGLAVSLGVGLSFDEWCQRHEKRFSSIESIRRRAIFSLNQRLVVEHNKKGNAFSLSLEGPFAAMTLQEYRSLLSSARVGLVQSAGKEKEPSKDAEKASGKASGKEKASENAPGKARQDPSELDWRARGVVPAVRDQGSCGSCYAFGSIAALESRVLIATGSTDIDLSEQEIVDCSTENNHCNGGMASLVYKYIKENGIGLEKEYPYTASYSGVCKRGKRSVRITGSKTVRPFDETALVSALQDGPVDVAVDANQSSFQFYSQGIYYDERCKNAFSALNHEMTAVGYGSNEQGEYWIVRNSWGSSWGMQGYILMARNKNNHCGIATDAVFPLGVESAES